MDAKDILFNIVYVVVMLRYGSDEGHHYICGVFNSKDKAIEAGDIEREDRAGKYEYVVMAHSMNNSCTNYKIIGYKVACSPEMPTMLDSNRDNILADKTLFNKLMASKERRSLYEDKYRLERDLKIVRRRLDERKKL